MHPNAVEIRPNYLTTNAEQAETDLSTLLKKTQIFGAKIEDVDLSPKQVIELVKEEQPGRLMLVKSKLKKEGIDIRNLPPQDLLDRLLGIDNAFAFNNKRFAVDVTTGKGTVLWNKKKKSLELEKTLNELGFDHFIVLRLRQEPTDDLALDFLSKIEDISLDPNSTFSHILKYSTPNNPSSPNQQPQSNQ